MFSILQLNCQGSKAVMCELGNSMLENGSMFALVQEPYAVHGRVCGVPANMTVFSDLRANAAIIVNGGGKVHCMIVSATDFGVCVSCEGEFGRVFLASAYCKFSEPLDPYLSFLDAVLLLASSTPVIIGIDANAASPLWFSKMSRHSSSHLNHVRGEELSEWNFSK